MTGYTLARILGIFENDKLKIIFFPVIGNHSWLSQPFKDDTEQPHTVAHQEPLLAYR